MSKRQVQVVFARRLLRGLGVDTRKLRVLPLPAGRGSGEQYVRENYPREVGSLRTGHVAKALVVVTDADTGAVAERQRQLEAQLKSADLEPRGPDEPIVNLIPRRNIMTWIKYLLGSPVNEEDKYPEMKGRESDCQPAVDRLVELYPSNKPPPASCPPSLVEALAELRRLPMT